ncbi:rhomboid family intramembrane serine protease [Flavobacterium sp.]|uniref:rhomboid family intramembrane serine protease n=1 Tax=Flavobacterium sp. TaxID=239 RepID=UPI0031D13171
MAFGFPASYTELIPLNQLSKLEFIQIAIKIFKKNNWSVVTINEDELIVATTNQNTWNETILFSFDDNTVIIKSKSNGYQIHDLGRNKKNTENFSSQIYEMVKDLPALNLDRNITIQDLEQENNYTSTFPVSAFYSFFSIFIPVKDYFITPILINLNLLLFIVMCFSGVNFLTPKDQDLIDWGANFGSLTTDNEWWRLFSGCFVHTNIIDLFLSVLALAFIGILLELYIKKSNFIILYILSAISVSLYSLYQNKDVINTGTAGVISSMMGILLVVFLFKNSTKVIRVKSLLISITLLIINILYSYIKDFSLTEYLAGFIIGILFGIILVIFEKQRKAAFIIMTSTATILLVFFYIKYKNTQVYIYQTMEYEERIHEFVDMEKMALEAYSTQYGNTVEESKEMVLYMIKDRGIYYWNENITLIKDLDKLYLPHTLHKRNSDLIKYCNLRIDLYELAYKKITENSAEYDDRMIDINVEIEKLLKKLNESTPDS